MTCTRVRYFILLACAFTFGINDLFGQQQGQLPRQEQIHQLIRFYEDQLGFNGNILIAESGKIIYENSIGWADLDNSRPLSLQTPFYLASVSKQFTAVSILILREEGKLDLDDLIIQYFPDLGEIFSKITIRNLLNHTSGIPDYFQEGWGSPGVTNAQIYEKLKYSNLKLNFRPGHKFRYSNTGYVLLSLLVEDVSGMPFYRFFDLKISEPLGLENTWVFDLRLNPKLDVRAVGYVDDLKKMNDYNLLTTGDGGIYSTIEDLFTWDQALYTQKIISQESLEEAFTPVTLKNGSKENYGYGWYIGNNQNGKTVYHTGGLVGFRTYLERQVDVKNTIIILNNNEFDRVLEMRNILVKIIDGRPYEFPEN